MKKTINWEELRRVNKKYFKGLKKKINSLEKSGYYILGSNVEKLEQVLAQYLGVKYCACVGNCLDALTISLKSLNLKEGGEVIVPSNTFYATVLSVLRAGLKPVLCEPNIETYNIETNEIEKLINKNTVAIMPVHLYGRPCEMDEIVKLSKKYNLKIVEDCAQGFGAEFHGKKVGSFGDAGCFSFYPTKNLGGFGDGGVIATNNKKIYDYCRVSRSYGGDKYRYDIEGINSRMDEIQAIFLLEKLKDIDKLNNKKIENANLYFKYLNNSKIILPNKTANNTKNVFHIFPIRCNDRDKLKKYLEDNNIQSIVHYPIPLYKQKVLSGIIKKEYKVSEEICDTILSLPCSVAHSKKEIMRVIEVLNNYR